MNNNFRNFMLGMGSVLDIYPETNNFDRRNDIQNLQNAFEKIGPSILVGYEKIKPGFSKKVFDIYKKEVQHRREMEKLETEGDLKLNKRGQVFGLTVSVLGLFIAGIIAIFGHEIAAAIIGALDITGLTSVFVFGRLIESKEKL